MKMPGVADGGVAGGLAPLDQRVGEVHALRRGLLVVAGGERAVPGRPVVAGVDVEVPQVGEAGVGAVVVVGVPDQQVDHAAVLAGRRPGRVELGQRRRGRDEVAVVEVVVVELLVGAVATPGSRSGCPSSGRSRRAGSVLPGEAVNQSVSVVLDRRRAPRRGCRCRRPGRRSRRSGRPGPGPCRSSRCRRRGSSIGLAGDLVEVAR